MIGKGRKRSPYGWVQACMEMLPVWHVRRERIPQSVKEVFLHHYDISDIAYQALRAISNDCTPSIDSIYFWCNGVRYAS
ncbi:hypothetical protein Krac_4217 [Ktedonobacter racemifer DSM 44963]|uniref:Uncharacterized protein n=1 Tax=Ktedonobacter racemifer DSM 44963 TaxID=485913 RepID=D6TYJ4_KTERA|nr:hypothetical protein Krac_4217 [Ktedonobacter racemifer DSM 44963]